MMRSKIRSLFYVACGAVIVPACGDDSPANESETETEGEDTDDSADDNPTEGIDPDTSAGEETTAATSVDTTNATTMDTSGGSETAGPCLLPEEIFDDPSFEDGAPWASWGQASTNFMTPLCDSTCGIDGASDGAFYSWFGGTANVEVGGLAQVVQIAETDSLMFSFDFQIQASSGNPDDRFYVTIDGDEVFSATADDMAMYAMYTQIDIDVTSYADGGEHKFEFISITLGGNPSTNFFLDNLQMGTCGGGMAVTVGDSVTGVDPTVGDTDTATSGDTDSGDPPRVCDEDIGMDVPFTQMGDNTGAGNDSHGSCTIEQGQAPGEDVTYSWTAPAAGLYQFDTLGSTIQDTVLYVYDACTDGTEIACNDDANGGTFLSALVVSLAADQTVAITVDGWSDAILGEFVLNISQVSCDPPTDLANALPITENGNNVGTGDQITPSCAPGAGGEDVTYTWTAPAAAFYTFDTIGSAYDTVLAGYSGICGDPAGEIGCSSDGPMSEFTTAIAADQQVTIVVDGADMGQEGDYDFNITQGGVIAGDCCAADATAGCQDAAVTNCVCGFADPGFGGPAPDDDTCCTGEWFDFCASMAGAICEGGCAGTPGGSCCDAAMAGGCDVAEVQDCVCAFDSYCCDTAWDGECAFKGQLFCNADCS